MAIAPETLEVDAVRQQKDSVSIDAFVFDEGVCDESRTALNPLVDVGKDSSFDREQDAMARRDSSSRLADRSMIPTQVVCVAAPAGPVEILMPGTAETVHHIEGPIARSRRHGSIESQHA
jgi:hypothetical protein